MIYVYYSDCSHSIDHYILFLDGEHDSIAADVFVPQLLKVSIGLNDWREEREVKGRQHWQLVCYQLVITNSKLVSDFLFCVCVCVETVHSKVVYASAFRKREKACNCFKIATHMLKIARYVCKIHVCRVNPITAFVLPSTTTT